MTLNEIFEKVSMLPNCPTISLNQVLIDDDLYTALVRTHKEIMEIIHTYIDSNEESDNVING